MSKGAKFWAVDLHVHTPGSSDAKEEDYGTPEEIVAAAIAAGLDAIAITDHNTFTWCDRIAAAAAESDLIVLPGIEISTTEGHLLAIWEEGTSNDVLRDLLVSLGIKSGDHGKLEVAARVGLASAAQEVAKCGGLAVPAHVDRPRGLLKIEVKDHLMATLLDESISAVEIVHRDTEAKDISGRVAGKRVLACIQGSDTWDVASSRHALSGIGARRTWIKASRPDLVGLRHAFADPELRLTLNSPVAQPAYPIIESIAFQGGFLDGQVIELCPDLNCLLGGTGSGKSLILEATRFALNQQADAQKFPAIAKEVQLRLSAALGDTGVVVVHLRVGTQRYRLERVYGQDGASDPVVLQSVADDWVAVDVNPAAIVSIAAFSQGEILEYAREPVGRMSLVDAGLDLNEIDSQLDELNAALLVNGKNLITARRSVAALADLAAGAGELDEQVRKIATFFDTETVKNQASWKTEQTRLSRAQSAAAGLIVPTVALPSLPLENAVPGNSDVFGQAKMVVDGLMADLEDAVQIMNTARERAVTQLSTLGANWETRFAEFTKTLDAELDKVKPGESLVALRARLEELQAKQLDSRSSATELAETAIPRLEALTVEREALLDQLRDQQKARRTLRRERVVELNRKTAGQVKLDIPNEGDYSGFRAALDKLKVGSRVRDEVLDAVAKYNHPLRFARALWNGKIDELVKVEKGIDAASIGRLLGNIDERNLWSELLDLQLIERPDVLVVTFKKPETNEYTQIENLAHGQKCTAILVILLADGVSPVLVDQPEDALHAPWIEDYLVDRLRSLRGTRQYLFPTRSPGIVVSGDAEQIITLKATATRSQVEASGSLERHDLNRLALHHLEGGPVPFSRRTQKLSASTSITGSA